MTERTAPVRGGKGEDGKSPMLERIFIRNQGISFEEEITRGKVIFRIRP